MARVPLAGTNWIPRRVSGAGSYYRAEVGHRRRGRDRGAVDRVRADARPGSSDVLVVERVDAGVRWHRQVQRHRPVPLRCAVAGSHGLEKPATTGECGSDILGTEIGFEQIGYVVGVGRRQSRAPLRGERRDAPVAGDRQPAGDRPRLRWASLWPYAELADLVGFAFEPRAVATATGLPYGAGLCVRPLAAAATRIRQASPVAALTAAGSVASRALSSPVVSGCLGVGFGRRSSRFLVTWPCSCSHWGSTFPVQAQREAILLVEADAPEAVAAADLRGLPVFSDLADLQYVRPERSGQLLVGNSDHSQSGLGGPG